MKKKLPESLDQTAIEIFFFRHLYFFSGLFFKFEDFYLNEEKKLYYTSTTSLYF